MKSTKPTLYVLVGLPGSGKTTLRKNLAYKPDTVVLSTDDYITARAIESNKTYNEIFLSEIKNAEDHIKIQAIQAIKSQSDVIWDQTNLSTAKRKKILNMFPDFYYKVCLVISLPSTPEEWEELNRRLKSRSDHTIPDHIMKNMISNYTMPCKSEGFDLIATYDMRLIPRSLMLTI